MTDLTDAARRELRRYAADEPLHTLYLQPDRAVYLAERAALVLKVYADAAHLQHEWHTAQRARDAGVPVPDLLGFAPGPPAVIAMRRVVGQPITSRQSAAAREAGALLARFHRLPASPPFVSGAERWEDHVLAWAEYDLASAQRLGILDEREIATLRARFVGLGPRIASRPVALLHADLQPAHILVGDDGRVAAFLDFADAQPGDPLLDIAVLSLWDEPLAAPVLAGYGIAHDDATRALLADYRLLRLVGEVPWLRERGFDAHAARSVAGIAALLARDGAG